MDDLLRVDQPVKNPILRQPGSCQGSSNKRSERRLSTGRPGAANPPSTPPHRWSRLVISRYLRFSRPALEVLVLLGPDIGPRSTVQLTEGSHVRHRGNCTLGSGTRAIERAALMHFSKTRGPPRSRVRTAPGGLSHATPRASRRWSYELVSSTTSSGAQPLRRARPKSCFSGAGLDTRAFRLQWPAGTEVFEVDQPDVLSYKEDLLAGAHPRCQRQTYVRADLRGANWPAQLTGAGFDPSAPAVWLAEGLLFYFPDEAIRTLSAQVSALASNGGSLGFDIPNQAVLAHPVTRGVDPDASGRRRSVDRDDGEPRRLPRGRRLACQLDTMRWRRRRLWALAVPGGPHDPGRLASPLARHRREGAEGGTRS